MEESEDEEKEFVIFLYLVIIVTLAASILLWTRARRRKPRIIRIMFQLGQNIAVILAEVYPSSPTPVLIPFANFTPTATDSAGPYALAQTTLTADLVVASGTPAQFTVPSGTQVYVVPTPAAADTITLDYGAVKNLEGTEGTVPNDSVVFEASAAGTVSSFLTVLP